MKTLVLTCLVLFASTASAQKPAAEAAYKHGQSLYLKEDYIGAAHHFKTAYDLDPDPVYLFNIAQAYRLAKKCKESSEYYNRFLLEAKKPPNEEAVKSYLVEVDACAQMQSPPTTSTAVVEPQPQPEPPPIRDEPPPRSKKRLVGYAVGGTGVVLTGLGFYFMARVASLEDDANAICPVECPAWDEAKSKRRARIDDQAKLREKLMVGSWIAGGAALAAGVYLIVTGGAKSESSISIAPTSNGAMASFRF
jgi:tetratricopeptide (TPR) repeat protein